VHVLATAGHVDHGKSTLVRALTGAEPDRLAEEHRRGLSIELGFCWTALPGVGDVAFVDVPGHERFITTMLAGVGAVPAVVFVVAADDPWMPQAAEHLAVLDALQVRHAVVAVTRSDLADPRPAAARAAAELRRTTLGEAPAVAVSAARDDGLDALRRAIADLVAGLPQPDRDADVRLWVDRCFSLPGAGTVVTGTLPAGRIRVGDTLSHGNDLLRVRGIQSLGRDVTEASGVARVALRLGGARLDRLERGSALVTPDAWLPTITVDVRLRGGQRTPVQGMLHVGAAGVPCHIRAFDDAVARLTLGDALPLRVGDRAVLRDPGSRAVWGVTVLDPLPPPLPRRRGAARSRAALLRDSADQPDVADELRRRGVARAADLERIGVRVDGCDQHVVRVGDWLLDRSSVGPLRERLSGLVAAYADSWPLQHGMPLVAAARALGLPDPDLVRALVAPPLGVTAGRVVTGRSTALPTALEAALRELERELAEHPFAAPDANRLAELSLDTAGVSAAVRAGRLLRVSETVVLLPGAEDRAAALLATLPQPFTTSEARQRLGTSRRVALPLLALLDRRGRTVRLPDDRRRMVPRRTS
jgi:selenocysteine-specific elongation factor